MCDHVCGRSSDHVCGRMYDHVCDRMCDRVAVSVCVLLMIHSACRQMRCHFLCHLKGWMALQLRDQTVSIGPAAPPSKLSFAGGPADKWRVATASDEARRGTRRGV